MDNSIGFLVQRLVISFGIRRAWCQGPSKVYLRICVLLTSINTSIKPASLKMLMLCSSFHQFVCLMVPLEDPWGVAPNNGCVWYPAECVARGKHGTHIDHVSAQQWFRRILNHSQSNLEMYNIRGHRLDDLSAWFNGDRCRFRVWNDPGVKGMLWVFLRPCSLHPVRKPWARTRKHHMSRKRPVETLTANYNAVAVFVRVYRDISSMQVGAV